MSAMLCPDCNGKTKIALTASNEEAYEVYRQRKCLSCGRTIHTLECEIELTGLNAVLYEKAAYHKQLKYKRKRTTNECNALL